MSTTMQQLTDLVDSVKLAASVGASNERIALLAYLEENRDAFIATSGLQVVVSLINWIAQRQKADKEAQGGKS